MKKILLCGFLFLATPVMADCMGGTPFNGATSGSFCISDFTMNYWTAISWCKANHAHLATWNEICPGVGLGSGECQNMVIPTSNPLRGRWVRISDRVALSNAYTFQLGSKTPYKSHGLSDEAVASALCVDN